MIMMQKNKACTHLLLGAWGVNGTETVLDMPQQGEDVGRALLLRNFHLLLVLVSQGFLMHIQVVSISSLNIKGPVT